MTPNNDILQQLSGLSSDAKRALLTKLMQTQSEHWEPLSYHQQAIWFHMNLSLTSTAYNLLYSVRLFEAIDTLTLQQICQQLVQRYPTLTATFAIHDEKPAQYIKKHQTLPIHEIDATTWSSETLRHEITSRSNQVIDLTQGPLFQILLFRCGPEETIMACIAHHIILDFWAFTILIDELFTLYGAAKAGRTVTLPPILAQHSDYVQWQQTMLASVIGQQHWSYWQDTLSAPLPVLQMPTDHPRPPVQSYQGSTFELTLSPTLTQQIRLLASKERVTPFTLVMAAYQTLLFRYTNQDDILIGTPTLGRDEARFERLIDDIANPVLIRSRLTSNLSFVQLLRQTQQQIFQALEHQEYPFSLLVERLQPERNLSHAPLYQTAFIWDKPRHHSTSTLTGEPFLYGQQGTLFDLALTIFEFDNELIASFRYTTALFEPDTIERLAKHFITLLEGLVAQPDQPIHHIPLLTHAEHAQLEYTWNDTRAEYPYQIGIHQHFEQQVQRTPESIVLVFDEQQLSYAELNRQANQLAHYLQGLHVGPDVLVGICMERSLEMVIGLLGILKAGGAYVPLDPAYPEERLAFLLADSQVPVLLTQTAFQERFVSKVPEIVFLDTFWSQQNRLAEQNPVSGVQPEHSMYMIYTSGSTGRPKGTLNIHKSVVNRLHWMQQTYQLTPQDSVVQKTPFTFDVSVWEFFWPLLTGARLVLAKPGGQQDPVYLDKLIVEQQITTLHFVPSMLNAFLFATQFAQTSSLKRVVCSGEVLPFETQERFFRQFAGVELHNLYGPTEAAIDVSFWACQPGQPVMIGRPIANVQLYVLNDLQPVPIGIPGELYIGGVALARGYWLRPDLTAERFIPSPFRGESGERLYRTGDLVRYRTEGAIEYLGRIDNQVKIRGHRVEMGEIEVVLNAQPMVRECVVLAQEEQRGDIRLVAYVVAQPNTTVSSQELRTFLQVSLPSPMLPSAFIFLEAFPLTSNGKIDRQALASLEAPQTQKEGHLLEIGKRMQARTPVEEMLLEMWRQVLGQPQLGINDNFFEAGGHSLLATQVIGRVRKQLTVEIPLRSIFEAPTVITFAQRVEQALRQENVPHMPPLLTATRPPLLPLSFAQQRLWFLNQLEPESASYLVPGVWRMTGPLAPSLLQQSLQELVRRHESLRTTFAEHEGHPVQVIQPVSSPVLQIVDLQKLNAEQQEKHVHQLAEQEGQQPFDLAKGPLLRTTLVRLAPEEHVLFVTLHHIITDGWSNDVLLRELMILYRSMMAGEPSPLVPLPVHYADYALWQRQWLQGSILEAQLAYWRQQLEDVSPLALPTDHVRPAVQRYQGASHSWHIARELAQGLHALCRQEHVTLFMTLLASFQVLLMRYSGQTDISVGTPIANRQQAEIENVIGFFVNTLVMRSNLSGNPRFVDLLHQVREVGLSAYAHQDVPFEQVVEALVSERDQSRSPLFQVMFILQNTSQTQYELAGLQTHPIEVERAISKFDLTLTIIEQNQELHATLEYNTDLFEPDTIEQLGRHFLVLLEGLVAQPDQPIQRLPLLTYQEQQQTVLDLNRTDTPLPHIQSIQQLIAERAQRTPDALALVVRTTALTYRELNERANQVAHRLRREGIGPDSSVGVCLERSAELIILLLGILKAGGSYIPLDPSYPAERLNWMLDDAQPALVLTQKPVSTQLATQNQRLFHLEEMWSEFAREETGNPPDRSDPHQTAYIIYTSGSTGRPKGVMISHHNVLNFCVGMDVALPKEAIPACKIWLAVTSISFDISVLELFWTLSRGFQVVLQTEQETRTPPHTKEEATPVQQTKNIEFSLFYFANAAYEEAAEEGYRLLLEGAQFADQHGFSAVWTPERHFHEFGGLYPNPSVISAALATLTRHIHIRAGSVVLPLHHPIRVAEEWALVDQLSHGRTGMAFASGWNANDFAFAPEKYAQRKAIMTRDMETVRALWRGESVSIQNGHGEAVQVRTFPRPIQAELPVWITSSGNIETFQLAGASGANVLTHLLGQNFKDLAQKIIAYREAWQQHGHAANGKQGHVTLMVHTFIGTDLQAVHDTVRLPFSNYLRSSADLMKSFAQRFGQDIIQLSEDDIDALIAHAFERYVGTSGLMGTVESCLPLVEQIKQLGVDEIACLIDFGVASDEVLASLHHLATLKEKSTVHPIQPQEEELSIAQQLSRSGASYLQCTPSLMNMLLLLPETAEALQSVRHLLLGGEALPLALVKKLQKLTPATIHNMYGPTETTIWSSTSQLLLESPRIVLGQPIANTQLYVLDGELQPVPTGVAGELYISGEGIARGYLNRPDLTAERFLPNPWSGNDGARMYRTGDLARYLANGDLEYLGRIDQQVKLHGYRIELGEIEAALLALPTLRECVVLVREDIPDEKRLVAYIVGATGETPTLNELRASLQKHLPDYMIPTAFVFLNALPLTSNGKIDRRALPPPEQLRPELVEAFVAPESTVETILATIWARMLKVDQIGVHDNFFALGGDSILSLQVVSRARLAGLQLTPRQLFQHQTIAELAAALANQTSSTPLRTYQQDAVSGEVALTPIQHWFFARRLTQPQYFNQAILITIPHDWQQSLLQRVFDALIVQHDALRARFVPTSTGWQQYFVDTEQAGSVPLTWNDLTRQPSSLQQAAIDSIMSQTQAGLDLQHGPLIRAAAFVSAAGQPIQLFVAIHHLVIDGISWRILLEDLYLAATQLLESRPVQFAEKTASLRDWTQHLYAMTETPLIQSTRAYWEAIVQQTTVSLPHEMPGGDNTQASAQIVTVALSVEETHQILHQAMRPYQSTAQELLLVALLQTLAEWLGHQHIRIELEGHGREELGKTSINTSRTIGWFTSLFPQSFPLRQDWDIVRWIKTLKEQLRAIPQNGVSYGMLRYFDHVQESPWPETTAEILFNYLGQFDQLAYDGLSLAQPASALMNNTVHPENQRKHLLEINSIISNSQLVIQWTYSEQIHTHQTIQKVATAMLKNLRMVLTHCLSEHVGGYTLSDFPLARLTQTSLDLIALRHRQFSDLYPLSPTQEGMLFQSLYEKTSGVYIHQFSCMITGPLDQKAFVQAWQHLVMQHPVLRTSFYWENLEKPQQIVSAQTSLPIAIQDWQQYTPQQQQSQLVTLLAEDRARGFDLQQAPLLRLTLLQLAPATTQLIWTYHHLLIDGWSLPLILQEVFDYYIALYHSKEVQHVVRRPYRDYIAWLQQQESVATETYWRQQLAGFKAATPLGIMPPDLKQTGSHEPFFEERYLLIRRQLSTEQTAHWRQQTRHLQLTLNTLFQGAWSLLLARYSQQRDILFGNVVSVRPPTLTDVEQMIGLLINTVPVRVQIPDRVNVEAWLRTLQAQQAEQRQYETSSLVEIQGWSEIPRNQPFFESLLVFENYPLDMTLLNQPHELHITQVSLAEQTNYPLVLIVAGTTELTLQMTYDSQRFATEATQRFMDHLLIIIEQFVQNPKLLLTQISLLTMEERAQQLYAWNNIAIPLSPHEKIDRQALSAPSYQKHMPETSFIPPQTPIQKHLAEIWCQLLALPRVSLQDNFFELDSHSELPTKLATRIQSIFEVNISQHDLFEAPTLQRMALRIEQIQNEIITQADDETLMQLVTALESYSDNDL